ncbi:MAG: thioredoxin family protein [Bacteroidetes bacterium]|nr:MAG: thioredoxin family protein [Bacteroidota bacterium]
MVSAKKVIAVRGMTYTEYRQVLDELFAHHKTTGDNHSEAMLHYTKMNIARMRRLDKTIKMLPETEEAIKAVDRPLRWITLTEGWCGDAAQIIPILEKMAALNPEISHELILRDEHPDIMDQFLTNGARAIPLTIILDAETDQVLGHWGPRPAVAQHLVMAAKAEASAATVAEDRKAIMDVAKFEAQKWYTKDKGRAVQEEFVAVLQAALTHKVSY